MNIDDSLINSSTTNSHLGPMAIDGDVKERYSIEMFEHLIQTVEKLKAQLSQI